MAVQVMVEGQGPFSFLVDTGAERTVIARELAERLGLGRSEKLRLAPIGVGTAIAPTFRVAPLHMTDLSLPPFRSEPRRVGTKGLSTCRTRWSTYNKKKIQHRKTTKTLN